jgi:hypothetical protein
VVHRAAGRSTALLMAPDRGLRAVG